MPEIGLIGCGRWGRLILRDLARLNCGVHVVDPDPACRNAAEQRGGVAAYETLTDLPEVAGAVVATPASSHAAVVRELLPRQIPLFVEKPFTTTSADADQLCRIADDRIFVMHVWRYHPGIRRLGDMVRHRTLGKVRGVRTTRTNWTSPRTDVDSLWTLVPHDLTIALEILGYIPEPRAILCERQGDRAVGAIVLCGDEPYLAIEASNRYRDKRREVRLHCENGVAVLSDADAVSIEVARDAGDGMSAQLETIPFAPQAPLLAELEVFVTYVKGEGPPPVTTAAEGLEVVRRIEQLRIMAGLDGTN